MNSGESQNNADILVRILPTPNPNALKFVVSAPVKTSGKATFSKPSEATGLRLASDLFEIDGIRQLHFFENVITITHSEEADIDTMRLEATAVIQRDMALHDPGFLVEEERRQADRSKLPPEIQQIEKILDRTVRMYLQGDGGDIEVVALKDHMLEVRYQGACGTCPSSISGTLDAIQGILQEQFDPAIQVVPV